MSAGDRGYLIEDLRRLMARVGANEDWFHQEWLGVPVWQLAEDLMRLQRVVHEVRPRWIVETGTKFGGSAIFFASLLELSGETSGGVVTVDVELTQQARSVFATHRFGCRVRAAIEGDAADEGVVARAREAVSASPGTTLVFLDDDHNADHVYREMCLYAPLVTPGSYLIVADTVFAELAGTPVGKPTAKYPDVAGSNPRVAVQRFSRERPDFAADNRFSTRGVGNFPDGFLRRVRAA